MKCKDCKHWHGIKGRRWGDCHMLIAKLEPNLLGCYNLNADEVTRHYFKVPFDPHEIKYWRYNAMLNEMLKLVYMSLPRKVRMVPEKKMDVVFDNNGGQIHKRMTYHHLQTRHDYECKED